jgi:hypothetical protein
MSRSVNGWTQLPTRMVAKQLGLLKDINDPLAGDSSNVARIEGKEACLDKWSEEVEDDEFQNLTSS